LTNRKGFRNRPLHFEENSFGLDGPLELRGRSVPLPSRTAFLSRESLPLERARLRERSPATAFSPSTPNRADNAGIVVTESRVISLPMRVAAVSAALL
jgi:hypothetical protein